MATSVLSYFKLLSVYYVGLLTKILVKINLIFFKKKEKDIQFELQFEI